MNKIIAVLAFALIASGAFAAEMTDDQKTFYALGMVIGKQTAVFAPSMSELEFLKKGLTDKVAGRKLAVDLDTWNPKIQAMAKSRREASGIKAAAAGKAFADQAAKEPGAIKTESGLIYRSLQEGTGASPAATDTVKVNYRGTLPDGTEFDSSYKRKAPAEFPLNAVIKCWGEGVQKMKVGGKAKLTCPPDIAYGDGGGGPVPPKATLSFEVELLSISPPTEASKNGPPDGMTPEMQKQMVMQLLQGMPKDLLKDVLADAQKNLLDDTAKK